METLHYKQTAEGALRIVLERGSRPQAPLLFVIHGGGWQTGNPEGGITSQEALCAPLREAGWAIAGVQYRLTDREKDIRLDDQMSDILDALCWLYQRREELGLDMSRVFTTGISAGGHLSLMTALAGSVFRPGLPVRILGEIDLCGPADLAGLDGREPGDWLEPVDDLLLWLVGAPALFSTLPLYRRASPFYYLNPQSPPLFLIHGTVDTLVPFRQSQRLYDRAMELGVPAVLCPIAHGWHDFQPAVQRNQNAPLPVPNNRVTPDVLTAMRMSAQWAMGIEASV